MEDRRLEFIHWIFRHYPPEKLARYLQITFSHKHFHDLDEAVGRWFLSIMQYRVPSEIRPGYVFTCVRNSMLDVLKELSAQTLFTDRDDIDESTQSSQHSSKLDWAARNFDLLEHGLQRLVAMGHAEEHELVVLRYLLEMPYKQLAARYGESIETIRVRMSRAIIRLRRIMDSLQKENC